MMTPALVAMKITQMKMFFDPAELDYHYDEAGNDNEYPENAPMDTPVWRNQVVKNHRQERTRAISSTD